MEENKMEHILQDNNTISNKEVKELYLRLLIKEDRDLTARMSSLRAERRKVRLATRKLRNMISEEDSHGSI